MQKGEIKVGMVTLGCPKNQCDAELMLGKIALSGYRIVDEPGLGDVVIINTCGFIQSAKEEAIEEILEAVSRKKDGINKKIIVTGCLAERYKDEMLTEFPEIDAVVSISRNSDIASIIEEVLDGAEKPASYTAENIHIETEGERAITTLPNYAYLRIADGCSNKCSYCAIPMIRGAYKSRRKEDIVAEAQALVKSGVTELILVAQDVTAYGKDLYGEYILTELLQELCAIPDLKWLRLMYCYPERLTDKLIGVIAKEPKIVKYLDIPLQHSDGDILRAMNRYGNENTLRSLIAKIRHAIPDVAIRTTLIAGFPGETEEQFTALAEFVNDEKFEHMGCFAYSEEEGTVAATLPEQVDPEVREHRKEVLEEQQEIRKAEQLAPYIGGILEVVVEGFDRYSDMYFGRAAFQAPEIDGMVYFSGKKPKDGVADGKAAGSLELYTYISVTITDIIDNNLIGTAC
ncbi:ribosomal protein S12 methylthiotransferase RimO [Clostridia bacterium]|nr:ribosomal protein S12 methylthiotransferase RimO [Clostridia bacterium]